MSLRPLRLRRAVFSLSCGATLSASLLRAQGGTEETVENFVVKEPNLRRKEGLAARETVEIPAGARELRVRVGGRFRGSVRVLSVSASRR